MATDSTSLGAEIEKSITGLLTRKAETSALALKAFRETFDAAWSALEELEASDATSDEAPRLIAQLTRTVFDHIQSVATQTRAEADVRVQAAVAETRRQRQEIASLSAQLLALETLEQEREADRRQRMEAAAERARAEAAEAAARLTDVRIEAERLRSDLETERKQAAAMVLEVGTCRMLAQKAEEARAEVAAERQKESESRKVLESELVGTRVLLEASRKEVTDIRQKLRTAVAEAVKLVAAADAIEAAETPAAPPNPPDAPVPALPVEVPGTSLLVETPDAAAAESAARLESLTRGPEDVRPEAPDESGASTGGFLRRRLAAIVRG